MSSSEASESLLSYEAIPARYLPQFRHGMEAMRRKEYEKALLVFRSLSLHVHYCVELGMAIAYSLVGLGRWGEAILQLECIHSASPHLESSAKLLEVMRDNLCKLEIEPETIKQVLPSSFAENARNYAWGLSGAESYLRQVSQQGGDIVETPGYSETLDIIPDIRIVGSAALLVTPDNRVLRESCTFGPVYEHLLSYRANNTSVRDMQVTKGLFANLCGVWAHGFWHWMMEELPQVLLLEESGLAPKYLVPDGPSFISASLALLGVPGERRVTFEGDLIRVEKLVLPKSISLRRTPELVSRLRERLLRGAILPKGFVPESRYFVARRDPGRGRRVLNMEEIKPLLLDHGLSVLHTEDYSLAEQIGIFSHANVLVGPHGAGMVHCLFMKERSTILEIFPVNNPNVCMLPVIEHLQHRYYSLISPSAASIPLAHPEDILLNEPLFKLMLRQALEVHG